MLDILLRTHSETFLIPIIEFSCIFLLYFNLCLKIILLRKFKNTSSLIGRFEFCYFITKMYKMELFEAETESRKESIN